MVRPRDQNTSEKIGQAGPVGYTQRKAALRSTKDQVARLHSAPCLVLSSYAAQQWETPENRDLFRVLDCCARVPLEKKSGSENEWINQKGHISE